MAALVVLLCIAALLWVVWPKSQRSQNITQRVSRDELNLMARLARDSFNRTNA